MTGEGFTQGHQVGPSKVQLLARGKVECLNTGVSGHCVARTHVPMDTRGWGDTWLWTHVPVDTRGWGDTCVARLKVGSLDTVIICKKARCCRDIWMYRRHSEIEKKTCAWWLDSGKSCSLCCHGEVSEVAPCCRCGETWAWRVWWPGHDALLTCGR